jgi:hypothetical protein
MILFPDQQQAVKNIRVDQQSAEERTVQQVLFFPKYSFSG